MPITKKLSGDGKISVNSQDVPAKVHYDIQEIAKMADNEPLLDHLLGELTIEGDPSFLANLLLEMEGNNCVLYLNDGRHVNFRLFGGNKFDFNRDKVLHLTIDLNGPIEK